MLVLDTRTRKLISAAIELLIDVLDRVDGDADFEEEMEGEPELYEGGGSPSNADHIFYTMVLEGAS